MNKHKKHNKQSSPCGLKAGAGPWCLRGQQESSDFSKEVLLGMEVVYSRPSGQAHPGLRNTGLLLASI